MTKTDLVEAVVKDAGISKKAAEAAIASVITSIQKTLKKGDKVSLVGFGTFSVTKRKARTGRNPRTGASLKIKASKSARFAIGKSFKDLLNK